MGKKVWSVARSVLGLRMCSWTFPADSEGFPSDEEWDFQGRPATPARSSIKSSCPICLEAIKTGVGQALFTAECSHTFHFSCIASNVKHGNMVCPVCRSRWKEVPWHGPLPDTNKPKRSSTPPPPLVIPPPSSLPSFNELLRQEQQQQHEEQDPVIRIIDESIANANATQEISRASPPSRQQQQQHQAIEPLVYDDDEALANQGSCDDEFPENVTSSEQRSKLELSAYAEVGSVSFSEQRNSFNVLVHVKAPELLDSGTEPAVLDRAPIDLVTVLDVSGSMAGTKLLLLKRAMAFVIRNLSSRDRLSVVVFSSSAKRLFPLKTMVEEGRQFALRAVETLVCTGGTNIAEGLRKGSKVLEERQHKNPVASIMLLSDGHDTYSLGTRGQVFNSSPSSSFNRHKLLSRRLSNSGQISPRIPVHTFGFGADHDAATMHSISQVSGGTFSFIQAEGGVQDAFAQCVGGLLSVVVQDVQLVVFGGCEAGGSRITSVHAGSYRSSVVEDSSRATVKLGDLYADEERDVLLEIKLPALNFSLKEQFILEARCSFTDPVRGEKLHTASRKLSIARPDFVSANRQHVSVEVDRQRNRLLAAKTISEAGFLADSGDIEAAQTCLRATQQLIQASLSWQGGDKLSKALESELGEIQERIGNRQLYERSGRAYILSAQSSHFSQRATTRGYSYNRDYQTPSMTGMILRSQQHPGYSSAPLRS
ncbi:uncharacterized protein LOC112345140 [Selaginella moellendorffii]|uniref:uncharacterized protein LOC112345140 n=1 Tax=Selaginella moellendorffii TaxID=88036 RepID=UPI000D1D0DDF|nr:uncharacterized protein LOC112345140 [Selaginella moellendorffii]|eukprot:XP_024527063.1 uncharacterized protein LOC112345140 [Selaginella moellendorffii]